MTKDLKNIGRNVLILYIECLKINLFGRGFRSPLFNLKLVRWTHVPDLIRYFERRYSVPYSVDHFRWTLKWRIILNSCE
jgi:hypothetical protein